MPEEEKETENGVFYVAPSTANTFYFHSADSTIFFFFFIHSMSDRVTIHRGDLHVINGPSYPQRVDDDDRNAYFVNLIYIAI